MINYKKLMENKIVSFILEWIKVIVIAFTLAIIVKYFVLETDIVSGISMEPTFTEGERVISEKVSYLFRKPKLGDIIVFHPNGDASKKYIKRVIGLENDVINIKDGKLYLNDKALVEDYIKGETYELASPLEFPLTVGKGELFVIGDNRLHSEDSRSQKLGLIKKEHIVSRVCMIIYPLDKMGIIK